MCSPEIETETRNSSMMCSPEIETETRNSSTKTHIQIYYRHSQTVTNNKTGEKKRWALPKANAGQKLTPNIYSFSYIFIHNNIINIIQCPQSARNNAKANIWYKLQTECIQCQSLGTKPFHSIKQSIARK